MKLMACQRAIRAASFASPMPDRWESRTSRPPPIGPLRELVVVPRQVIAARIDSQVLTVELQAAEWYRYDDENNGHPTPPQSENPCSVCHYRNLMRASSSWYCQAKRILVLSALLPGCAAHTSGSLSRPEAWCDLDVPAGASLLPLPANEEMRSSAHSAAPRQSRWVVVWASWCEPCRAELPRVEAVLDEAHRRGIELDVILLSIDADVSRLADFVRVGPAFLQRARILRATSAESFDAWAKRFALESSSVSLPVHLLADRDGVVTCMHTGALQAGDVALPGKLLSR